MSKGEGSSLGIPARRGEYPCMRLGHIGALFLFFSLAACAADRIHSSYQIYPTRVPSSATSFSKVSEEHSDILKASYEDEAQVPIRLTASDGTGLAMESLRVRTVIRGPIAFTELKMAFHNPRGREIEGRFEIVLPDDASVARLAMKMGTRWQDAEVVSRKRGQEVYESFLHKQVDPVLLETSVGNRFRARVYPIPAKGDKEIIISYTEQLPASGDYRLAVGGLPMVRELDVDIHHGSQREQFVKHNFVGKSDIVVPIQNATNVAVNANGLVMMRWVPEQKDSANVPRQISVLVDSSASAAGVYGQQVRAVSALAEELVAAHGEGVEFTVACFDHEVSTVFSGLAKDYGPSESDALLRHGALGATNLEAALAWARTRPGRLLLVGDGIATTRKRAWQELGRGVGPAGPERVDVLALASASHHSLLVDLAQQGGRTPGVVLSPTDAPKQWVAQMGQGAAAKVSLAVPGATWVWPESVRALRPGEAVTVFAKFDGSAKSDLRTIRMEELRGDEKREFELKVVPAHAALVEREWAEVQIARLLELQQGHRTDVRQALVESLSHRFRIITPATSFLMLESESDYSAFGIDREHSGPILVVDATGLRTVGGNTSSSRDWQVEALVREPFERSGRGAVSSDGSASIAGQVRDKATGELLAGVTVVATIAADRKNFNAISDGRGSFRISGLPVGAYDILLIYGDVKSKYSGVRVEPGAVAKIFAKLDLTSLGGETVTVRGRAQIDTSKTSQGMTIDREFVQNIPIPGRTFEGALSVAAGNTSPTGVSFSGSSSLENQYVVDGVNASGSGYAEETVKPATGTEVDKDLSVQKPANDSSDIRRFRKIRKLLKNDALSRALRLAIHWYSEAPANLLAIAVLGEALHAAGHYKLAMRAYASILDVYPSRADMHRVAAGYLGQLGPRSRNLRRDALRFAYTIRPDHAHGTRLLAMEMAAAGHERAAIELLLFNLEKPNDRLGRQAASRELMRRDAGTIAAAWLAREPQRAHRIQTLLHESGIMVPMEAQQYAVLSWESDVTRMDLEVLRRNGGKPVKGEQTHIADIGYGPEVFALEEEATDDLEISAVLAQQAMTGFAFANVQVVRLDSRGGLNVETRPFVALEAHERIAIGGF